MLHVSTISTAQHSTPHPVHITTLLCCSVSWFDSCTFMHSCGVVLQIMVWIGPPEDLRQTDINGVAEIFTYLMALHVLLGDVPAAEGHLQTMKDHNIVLGWKTSMVLRSAFLGANNVEGYHQFFQDHDLHHTFKHATPRHCRT